MPLTLMSCECDSKMWTLKGSVDGRNRQLSRTSVNERFLGWKGFAVFWDTCGKPISSLPEDKSYRSGYYYANLLHHIQEEVKGNHCKKSTMEFRFFNATSTLRNYGASRECGSILAN